MKVTFEGKSEEISNPLRHKRKRLPLAQYGA